MKIRITRGIYGFRQDGNVVEKTSSSDPFDVDEEEGNRLISLNVAEKVNPTGMLKELTTNEELPPYPDEETDIFSQMGSISKKSLKGMRKEDLLEFAEALGIENTRNKEELVERLKQCPVWAEDAEVQDGEEEPDLFAEDPE